MAEGFSFSISIQNIAGTVNWLKMLAADLKTEEILHAIGNAHLRWMVLNLRDAGTEQPHQPMSPNTLVKGKSRSSARHFSSRFRAFLQQSYTVKVDGDHVDVGTANEMAKLHHYGTHPYTIRPKAKGTLLHFKTVRGMVFVREVHHPGIPARGLLPSKKTAEALALKVLTGSLNKALRGQL